MEYLKYIVIALCFATTAIAFSLFPKFRKIISDGSSETDNKKMKRYIYLLIFLFVLITVLVIVLFITK